MLGMTLADAVIVPTLVLTAIILSPLPNYLLSLWAQHGKGGQGSSSRQKGSVSGYIVPAQIHHARIVPREAQHSFKYPSIYYAFELHALEQHSADRAPVFCWTGDALRQARDNVRRRTGWSMTRLHPNHFGRKSFPGIPSETAGLLSGSMLLKLMYELRFRGYISHGPQDVEAERLSNGVRPWEKEVGQVWAIAMPTILGLAGFNPLTVYYVYRPGSTGKQQRGGFWLAVLEVHNTFNERHIYVCEKGTGEDDRRSDLRRGYDHSWTFARDFHVSPFNDRSGYYQLFLRDMWGDREATLPTIDVRLLLLAPCEEGNVKDVNENGGNRLQKKLLATLTSSQATSATPRPTRDAEPITAASVISTLLRQPFDLFLPVARIMWEAARLHWKRKLPVYIRPEPSGDALALDKVQKGQLFDGLGWPIVHNPVQAGSIRTEEQRTPRSSGDIFWNDESFVERICRRNIERLLLFRTRHSSLSACVKLCNPEIEDRLFRDGQSLSAKKNDDARDCLAIFALSPAFYADMCLYTPTQAFLFGSQVERGWGVSSIEAFMTLFDVASTQQDAKNRTSLSVRLARYLRVCYMRWSVNEALAASTNGKQAKIGLQLVQEAGRAHPLDQLGYPVTLLSALALHISIVRLTAGASKLLNVRYVRHPWAQVSEGIALLASRSSGAENADKS